MLAQLKFSSLVLLTLLGSSIAFCTHWGYQWDRAEREANAFCRDVTVGSNLSSAIARAKGAQKRVSEGIREGETFYVIFFPGPIFNQFTCELTVADGKIASSTLIEPKD